MADAPFAVPPRPDAFADLFQRHNWAATALGPQASWPALLHAAVQTILPAPSPLVILWGEHGAMLYNEAFAALSGRHHPAALGRPVREAWPEIAEFNGDVLRRCLAGESLIFRDMPLLLNRGDAPEQAWFDLSYSPLPDAAGRPAGVFAMVTETTGRMQSERQAREAAAHLEALNRAAGALAGELDIERLVQAVVDAGTQLCGAAFGAFFYNTVSEHGETHSLYTLSGAARESFARFPMPRGTPLLALTFRGEATVRADDITTDPRFGHNAPNAGMPPGHLPVRSYLALPVLSRSGTVLGGLLFGHPEPARFTARHEHLLTGITVQAAVALDNARLFQSAQREIAERRNAEDALRELAATLERRVGERTAALSAAHERLRDEMRERENLALTAREAERRFRLLVEGVTDCAIFMLDPLGQVVNWNAGAARIKGYAADQIVGAHFSRFFTEADRVAGLPARCLATALRDGRIEQEGWRVRRDGSRFWAHAVIDPIRDEDGTHLGFAKITRDMTERRAAQDALEATRRQLAQAQKMEAIGQLTGGIAHDFNNLLHVVNGNLELLGRDVAGDSRAARRIANARAGVARGAKLASQLLAFGRRQPLAPRVVNAASFLRGLDDLLHRALGEAVVVELAVAPGLWNTLVDPGQVENALLNLAINARDAMHGEGRLRLEARNAVLDPSQGRLEPGVAPGDYVALSVSDTGHGIPPEILDKVFEPFFSTKPDGKGSGLGLSMVYGFVKQSGGQVEIHSEVGRGTTVSLYLPRAAAEEQPILVVPDVPVAAGSEAVLVVEDDEAVLGVVVDLVSGLGYRVTQARDAAEALALLEGGLQVDLLFTDVVMPGPLRATELAARAGALLPGLAVLFTSGYTQDAIVHDGRLDPGIELLSKPYTREILARRFRQVLGAATRPARASAPPAFHQQAAP